MRELYIALAKRFAEELSRELGPRLRSVCIFGSVARGAHRKESDLDVIVVAKGLPRDLGLRHAVLSPARDRAERSQEAAMLRRLGYSAKLSGIYLTPRGGPAAPPILLDVVEDGVMIHDREGFLKGVLERIAERLRELGAKRVWTKKGWYWVLKPDARLGEEVEV
jgi:hypothetical protein